MVTHRVGRTLLLAALLALLPAAAWAQTGRIIGTVTGQDGAPIRGAQVSVVDTRFGTLTGPSGQFVLTSVPVGAQQLRVGHIGYREQIVSVTVRAGDASSVAVQLEGQPVELGGVVISAARRPQRITDAPATITHIGPNVLDNSIGNTWAGALKEVKGLDFIQVGMTSVAINARGFNSSFNNRMLMMEDGRIAVLPENGLPVGQFTATPKIDLAGVEVLVGAGTALYGADASSGVVTLMSKDPRQFPGTTVEVTGGNRSYRDVQARHAGVIGNWGYKVAGEWQEADDWENVLSYNITGLPGGTSQLVQETDLGPNSIDWNAGVTRGTGALVYYHGNNRLEVSGGASQTNGVGQTNVGRNQLRDWQYNFLQARYTTPHFFFNAYRTQSKSGESFAINRYADAMVRNPGLSPDSLRMLSDWPSNGQLYAAEVQSNFRLPMLLNTEIVWGGQFRRDIVSSDRQWLTDRLTGQDIEIDQKGVYGQAETPLMPWLNFVLAARYDDHENYDAQFSPKAGVVFKPAPDQALRFTYNRAFKSPTTLQTNFHIPDWTGVIAIYGNRDGFTVRDNAAGTGEGTSYSPLVPEENQTWEAGYKGVFANRLFVDVAGYYSNYEHFLSPLVVIANPFAVNTAGTPTPTFAYDARGELFRNPANLTPVVLTYVNLGKATIYGTDAGVNFFLTPKISLNGTLSLLKVDSIEVPAGREEATAINAPNTKWTVGTNVGEFGHIMNGAFFGGASVRHVNSYYFRSGINMGVIPTFTTLDMNVGYRLPRWNTSLNVGVSNLFTCSQDDDPDKAFQYAATDPFRTTPTNKERKCGFGLKHQEMINMPQIGTMVFIGARYHLQ